MAVTCPQCHSSFNDHADAVCSICGASLRPLAASVFSHNDAVPDRDLPSTEPLRQQHPFGSASGARITPPPPQTRGELVLPSGPQSGGRVMEGRVTQLERHDEVPRPDYYRWLTLCLLFVLLFIPYIVIFIGSCLLSISFGIIGFPALAHIFNPFAWTYAIIELLEVAGIFHIGSVRTVPVYRGRIEFRNGEERGFMLNGPLLLGDVIVGDNVRLVGAWRDDTFLATGGRNLTTTQVIRLPARSVWRILFFILLGIYVLIGWYAYSNGLLLSGFISAGLFKS